MTLAQLGKLGKVFALDFTGLSQTTFHLKESTTVLCDELPESVSRNTSHSCAGCAVMLQEKAYPDIWSTSYLYTLQLGQVASEIVRRKQLLLAVAATSGDNDGEEQEEEDGTADNTNQDVGDA